MRGIESANLLLSRAVCGRSCGVFGRSVDAGAVEVHLGLVIQLGHPLGRYLAEKVDIELEFCGEGMQHITLFTIPGYDQMSIRESILNDPERP